MNTKVFVVDQSNLISLMFVKQEGYELVESPGEAGLIVYTGGHDVSPSLYGHEQHHTSQISEGRDRREKELFEDFVGKVPMVGICRGGQFLWVMNGGELYQDVDGHANGSDHPLFKDSTISDGMEFICNVTSTHHQMMKVPDYTDEEEDPFKNKVEILAFGVEAKNKIYYNKELKEFSNDNQGKRDIEVAYFKETNTLCFQPHPEYNNMDCREYFFKTLWNYLIDKG